MRVLESILCSLETNLLMCNDRYDERLNKETGSEVCCV